MKWYKWEGKIGKWKCLHCEFSSPYRMGMNSHTRKHKREMGFYEEKKKQQKLTDDIEQIVEDNTPRKHKPYCVCYRCKIRRMMTGQ